MDALLKMIDIQVSFHYYNPNSLQTKVELHRTGSDLFAISEIETYLNSVLGIFIDEGISCTTTFDDRPHLFECQSESIVFKFRVDSAPDFESCATDRDSENRWHLNRTVINGKEFTNKFDSLDYIEQLVKSVSVKED